MKPDISGRKKIESTCLKKAICPSPDGLHVGIHCIYKPIYTYVHLNIYMYTYVKVNKNTGYTYMHIHVYIHIYIYIGYIHLGISQNGGFLKPT